MISTDYWICHQDQEMKFLLKLLLLGICERRGSGIDRAIEAIEARKLPAVKFEKSESHTKVILFPPKELKEMSKTEKIRACY
ncbi:hypothetical protein NO004_560141 [Flavobacterium psychrophilum]|nr:ATP-binding protein [Flavobacterium psychrophilum]SNB30599.1 hypothetical protein NO004_560141 [Flavobacterium psychrophilum]